MTDVTELVEFVQEEHAAAAEREELARVAWKAVCDSVDQLLDATNGRYPAEADRRIADANDAYDAASEATLRAARTMSAVQEAVAALEATRRPLPAQPEPEDWTPIWVCSDCQWVEANGGPNEAGPLYEGSPVPLNEIPVGARIVAGLTTEHHWSGCSRDDRASGVCTCETEEISSRRCDGCGSTLDGYRHGYMLVTPAEVQTP